MIPDIYINDYHVDMTEIVQNGSETVILKNDYMPVVPTVITTADTTLSWKIAEDSFRKTLSAGEWELPELQLTYGENAVKVEGSGMTMPMRLFRVYVDGNVFYHPNLSKLAITEAKVSEDAENIDSLTLSAPYNHPYIDSIKPMASVIVCKKGEETVFEGRALDDGSDFYNTHTWTCESALAYLKDTVQPPFSYKGTLRGLLEQFISVHNKAVEQQKQFKVGNITVTDDNDYVAYSSSDYSVTMDAIKNKLINTHGGYLMVRYENDGKYLDYLADFKTKSVQKVEYGKNITDVKITRDHTERVTVLIPLGAKKKITDAEGNEIESEARVDITSVNGGKNYISDDAAVKEIGWIWKSEVWDDVTLPSNLLRKAKSRLSDLVNGVTSIQLTIVDESDTGADIGDIRARMYVECISKPHGINGTYLCVSRTRDYLNPSGNTITIGASGVSLSASTVKQDKNISALEDDLYGQTRKIDVILGEVDNINAQKMYRTELIVEGVNIFKTKGEKSTMLCKVYSWDKDITESIDAECFIWHRKSSDEEADTEWDKNHIGMKKITITTEDVLDNASFYCEIKL